MIINKEQIKKFLQENMPEEQFRKLSYEEFLDIFSGLVYHAELTSVSDYTLPKKITVELEKQGFPMEKLNPDQKFSSTEFDEFVGKLKVTLNDLRQVEEK